MNSENDNGPSQQPEWLVLVPTQFELGRIRAVNRALFDSPKAHFELCGFGAIISGVFASQVIAKYQSSKILLMGIAGAYPNADETRQMGIGDAALFRTAACFGIGAGSGEQFQAASELGWKQWRSESAGEDIEEAISLETGEGFSIAETLVTCTAASASQFDVEQRMGLFPDAVAEDMEAFAVASACKLSGRSLSVIRGISNVAGDRDKGNWNVDKAIFNATKMAANYIGVGHE